MKFSSCDYFFRSLDNLVPYNNTAVIKIFSYVRNHFIVWYIWSLMRIEKKKTKNKPHAISQIKKWKLEMAKKDVIVQKEVLLAFYIFCKIFFIFPMETWKRKAAGSSLCGFTFFLCMNLTKIRQSFHLHVIIAFLNE